MKFVKFNDVKKVKYTVIAKFIDYCLKMIIDWLISKFVLTFQEQTNGPSSMYDAIAQQDTVRVESEKIRLWREQQKETLEKKGNSWSS